MIFLFSPLGLIAILFAFICVGFLLLPLYSTFKIVGVLGVIGGLVMLPTHPWSGVAFIVAGVVLIILGVKWQARVDRQEAQAIEEAARRASRTIDATMRWDDTR